MAQLSEISKSPCFKYGRFGKFIFMSFLTDNQDSLEN